MNTAQSAKIARQIDGLLAKVGYKYRRLPRRAAMKVAFREALSYHGLPGGYAHRGTVMRSLTEALTQEGTHV